MYFTRQSLILPRVQPLGPGMGGFESPCINRQSIHPSECYNTDSWLEGLEKFHFLLRNYIPKPIPACNFLQIPFSILGNPFEYFAVILSRCTGCTTFYTILKEYIDAIGLKIGNLYATNLGKNLSHSCWCENRIYNKRYQSAHLNLNICLPRKFRRALTGVGACIRGMAVRGHYTAMTLEQVRDSAG